MEQVGTMVLVKELFSWRAILDIFLIAAGVFFLYRTLLRLGTWKIVAGILVAMAIFLVANFMDLKGIGWIFSNISQVAVIALIVLFQPELRKILEQTASVKRSEPRDLDEKLSHLVVDALVKLAQQRRGAIVVFPGKEPIQEWLSGGFVLDAKPSLPLIMSIFDPNSPGHDGALVITNGEFSRFGVRLPVSQSSRLPEEYGTRHHAAMGLVEKSDALAIVVSEERGNLSIFRKGRMRQVSNGEEMVKTIISHWKDMASFPVVFPKGKARWPVFLQIFASLVLAAIFWSTLAVSQGEILEKVITVPVEYTASSPNLTLVGNKAEEVRLHLSGPKSALDTVNPSHTIVKIDLSKALPGKQSFFITRENIQLPKDIHLLDVIPPSFELTLAEIVEKELIIKPQLVGKLPGGLKIRSLEVKPGKVKVFSPTSDEMDKLISLTTTPIYLNNIYENTTIYCKIVALPAVQPKEKRWPDVVVVITVGR
ncbi:MAG: diadenylate cyclase [Desulfobacteraceae bacterium]|nr:diadenylate cyclase [Desulfobacteraceae bacterium]MDH3572404.1 diadenylate cyclase [Desulfobacteraceae bacterium]MDH3874836.1 diadenylate cyclase [Desulfobacteraceae bacterium]